MNGWSELGRVDSTDCCQKVDTPEKTKRMLPMTMMNQLQTSLCLINMEANYISHVVYEPWLSSRRLVDD